MSLPLSSTLARLSERLQRVGLTVLVIAEDDADQIAVIGHIGGAFFTAFADSPEYQDGEAHPLDRYSRRVLLALSDDLPPAATLIMPSDVPYAPFQSWARQGAYHPSPLGLLIHQQYGLWTAFRGAWRVPNRTFDQEDIRAFFPSAKASTTASPCDSCAEKPCLSACPVQAFHASGFSATRCRTHLDQPDATCWSRQCLARLACPIATDYQYTPETGKFFLSAFHRAIPT